MKYTKSLISILLCLIMLFGATACGMKDSASETISQEDNNLQIPTSNAQEPVNTENHEEITPAESIPDHTNTEDSTEPTEISPATDPTENDPTESEPQPTEPTENEETNPTEPTEPESTVPSATAAAYLAYNEMSAAEQQDFINSFDSIEAFFSWLNTAKAVYEAERTPIDGSPITP